MIENLPHNRINNVVGIQLLRSGTSIEANYRAACRSRSKVEFISKIRVVEEQADESVFWIEIIKESKILNENRLIDLLKEAGELTAIFTSIGKSTKQSLKISGLDGNSKSEIPYSKSEAISKSEIPNSKS